MVLTHVERYAVVELQSPWQQLLCFGVQQKELATGCKNRCKCMEVEEVADLLKMHVGLSGFEVVGLHQVLILVFAVTVEVVVSLCRLQ